MRQVRANLSGLRLSRFASAFVIMLVLLVLSSAVYFGQAGESVGGYANPLRPSYIYALTYAFSGLLGLVILARRAALPSNGFVALFLVFGALHLAWMPFVPSDLGTDRTLVLRLNVVVMTVCCQVILSAVKDMDGVVRAVRAVVWGTCLLNLLVLLAPDVLGVQMSAVWGRAAGLYWDPNQCATFLAMLLPLTNCGLSRPYRLIQSLVVLMGIFLTFSREGIVLWVAAVLLGEVVQPGERRPQKLVKNSLIVSGAAVFLISVCMLAWDGLIDFLHPYLTRDTYARLSGSDQGSAEERLFVLKAGWDLFLQNPVLGAGYAATRGWHHAVSVHNMFLLMLAEFGIVGGLWYLTFLGRVFAMPLRFGVVLGALVVLESLFTHSYFDLFYYMLLVLLYWRFANLLAGARRKGCYENGNIEDGSFKVGSGLR